MDENFIILKQKALQIRDEVEDNANSAYRVGKLFQDIVAELEKHLPNESKFGNNTFKGITQKAFTDHVQAIEKNLGNESTSESEDGSIWGKLISIIQDVSSNSTLINNIEVTLSKASLFNNLGIITGLSSLDDVKSPGYYTYSNRLNEGETINGILVVSRMSYPGSFSIVQFRHELGKTYQREYDIDERAWEKWEEQTVVMSESDYEQLEFKDQSTFYYTYED